MVSFLSMQEERRSRQEKKYCRQDPHVSTPSAGQGFAAPSFVGGSGGCTRQHSGQRAFSAATFKFASVSVSSLATFLDTTASGRHSCSSCLAPPVHRDNASCKHCQPQEKKEDKQPVGYTPSKTSTVFKAPAAPPLCQG
jgi:hypothetical protein